MNYLSLNNILFYVKKKKVRLIHEILTVGEYKQRFVIYNDKIIIRH